MDQPDPSVFLTRAYWDERYRYKPVWSGNPNTQLVHHVADLPPGTALDVGSGEGGDALWLAARGWRVTGADISEVALRRSAEAAERAGLADRLTWQQADLLTWTPPPATFDLVTAFFVHLPGAARAALLRRLAAAVRPGGTLLFVAHHPADLEVEGLRPPLPEMFATGEELAELLDPEAWTITTAAPDRPGEDKDGNPLTLHDAVLRAVRA
jgi:SAM-dependent methyltransferase